MTGCGLLRRCPCLLCLRLCTSQGPSFHVEGHHVRWQKWDFRVGFNPREGLVLHLVSCRA